MVFLTNKMLISNNIVDLFCEIEEILVCKHGPLARVSQ